MAIVKKRRRIAPYGRELGNLPGQRVAKRRRLVPYGVEIHNGKVRRG
jgi:hypothetical protein